MVVLRGQFSAGRVALGVTGSSACHPSVTWARGQSSEPCGADCPPRAARPDGVQRAVLVTARSFQKCEMRSKGNGSDARSTGT